MRLFIIAANLLAASVFASPTGKYENLLVDAMLANAAGECPASLMQDVLKASCDSQLTYLKLTHVRLGSITSVSFQGTRPLQGGTAEVYKVGFQHGDWTWVLNTRSDGKMLWAFAPNPPNWDVASFSTTPSHWASY